MRKEINYLFWAVVVFSALILLVNIFSSSYGLTDVSDYLGSAKGFSGSLVTKMRSNHSWVYGLLLAQPLKIFQSLALVKLLNVMWIILIGILIYKLTNNKRAFLLYAFSPIVWYMSTWISPIMLATFLFMISYFFFKEYEKNSKIKSLMFSGLFFGLSMIIWDTMMFLFVFFIISFFYNKKLKEIIIFLIPLLLAFSIRLFVDYQLFSFPIFSIMRALGGNALAFLRMGAYAGWTITPFSYVLMFISISPIFVFLFPKLIKADFRKYSKEIVFITLTLIMLLMNPQIRYLFVLAPLVLILLSEVSTKRETYLHVFLSIILIFIFLAPCFGQTYEYKIREDIIQIARDFPNQTFLAGNSNNTDLYAVVGINYWGRGIKEIISWQDYDLWRKNETNFQDYRIESKNHINEIRKLWIEIGLSRADNRTFENVDYLINDNNQTELSGFNLQKSYNILSVFKK